MAVTGVAGMILTALLVFWFGRLPPLGEPPR
jgi:hypothetical protein